MRTLKHITVCWKTGSMFALDEEGELWYGKAEATEDKRRVVEWSPVQLPPDGMSFSEPQLSFWDRMEKEAHEKYQASLEPVGETPTVEKEEQIVASGTGAKTEGASDVNLEDGEGTDTRD